MKVYHLIVQGKAKWGGNREVFASADEYTMDENPSYMQAEIRKVIDLLGTEDESDKEYVAYGVVSVEVSDVFISSVLNNWIDVT